MSSPARQLVSLGRAEATLFFRTKANFVNVLFIPVFTLAALHITMGKFDLGDLGLSMGPVMVATAVGIVLVFSLYVPLTTTYVARRDELLLKRLRTGEVADPTVLTGTALPSAAIVLVQTALIAAVLLPLTGAGAPPGVHWALAAVVLGILLMCALAAATSALARTTENVQVAVLPLLFLLPTTSGTFFPLEAMPQLMQDICHWLPMTPVIDLVRSAWTHTLTTTEALLRLVVLAGWTVLALGAARRWFRWEPRT
ncbi:ABC transporter permease [Streptomyces nigrescens]